MKLYHLSYFLVQSITFLDSWWTSLWVYLGRLVDRINELEQLNSADLALLYRVIDAFLAKNKLQHLAKGLK